MPGGRAIEVPPVRGATVTVFRVIESPGPDPLPRRDLLGGRGDGANELPGRANSGKPDVDAGHRFPGRQVMIVGIDESRQEQPALQVDSLGSADPASHLVERADSRDARALNGYCLGSWRRRVHRANHTAREDEPFASAHNGTARRGVWLSELLQPAANEPTVPSPSPARKRRRVMRKEGLESTPAPDPIATPPTDHRSSTGPAVDRGAGNWRAAMARAALRLGSAGLCNRFRRRQEPACRSALLRPRGRGRAPGVCRRPCRRLGPPAQARLSRRSPDKNWCKEPRTAFRRSPACRTGTASRLSRVCAPPRRSPLRASRGSDGLAPNWDCPCRARPGTAQAPGG